MTLDLVRAVAELEGNMDLHAARLLVLLRAFAGGTGTGRIEGLTKLAKLDFLLRYPVMLERALQQKGRSVRTVGVRPHERASVESRMVRYRFGPWDHRYRQFLNTLIARDLAAVSVEGKTVSIGLTPLGVEKANAIAAQEGFTDIARRAKTLHANFNLTATHLMRFIYDTFPEVLTLEKNEPIPL